MDGVTLIVRRGEEDRGVHVLKERGGLRTL